MNKEELPFGTIAFCFLAHFDMGTAIVMVHIPHNIEMILSASVPCSAGVPRAVIRASANGVPSTPGRLDRNEWKRLNFLPQTAKV